MTAEPMADRKVKPSELAEDWGGLLLLPRGAQLKKVDPVVQLRVAERSVQPKEDDGSELPMVDERSVGDQVRALGDPRDPPRAEQPMEDVQMA